MIAGGGADVVIDWMPSALATREKGVPLVNIAQPFKRSGMELTCRADTGIKSPKDFKNKTLGVWFSGNEYPFLAWMAKLDIKTDGSPGGVKVLKQGFNVDPLLQKQADCISTMTYNEYWQVIDGGMPADKLVVFKYEDQGVATHGGRPLRAGGQAQGPGLRREDGPLREGVDEGLGMGASNPTEAAKIVLDNDATGAQTEKHQVRMMGEINKLTAGTDGTLAGGRLHAHRRRSCSRAAPTRSSPRSRQAPGRMPSRIR